MSLLNMPEKEIEQLQPKEFWENFAAICKVPRSSGNETQLCNFIKKFAEDLGLEVSVDTVGNLFVKKPATPGMEDCKGVILQAHLDIVPEKNPDVVHDFLTDPLQPYIDGDWVKAKGTVLGADDGAGLAAIMGVLQSKNIKHGPIEAVFTVDEEVNFTGVNAIKPGLLTGEILFNLDSDIEGELTIGSGGGILIDGKLGFTKVSVPKNAQAFTLQVHGLKGGHSAIDIDKPMASAIKILNRLLWLSRQKFDLNLIVFDGGKAYNAIPRDATAMVVIPTNDVEEFKTFVEEHRKFLVQQFPDLKDLQVKLIAISAPDFMPDPKAQKELMNLLYAFPHGIIAMSKDIQGLIETSCNLAIVETTASCFKVSAFPRSSVDFMLDEIINTITSLFVLVAGHVKFYSKVPTWQPVPNLPIVELMSKVYVDKFGQQPKITATHAATESGAFKALYPNLQIVSFGPTIENCHTPNERLNIKSVNKYWELLIAVLENIPKK